MKNVFDWTKEITTKKSPLNSFTEEDWNVWNSYMVHKVLSMNPDLIEVVNLGQTFPPHEKKQIYLFYKEFVPKNNKWYKYIKNNSVKYNEELINNLKDHFSCSKKEVINYLKILNKKEIESILKSRGLNEKEIKKLKL